MTLGAPISRHGRPADAATLLTVLIEAFRTDPFWAHFIPDPDREGFAREDGLRDCMIAEIQAYVTHGHTYVVDHRAAALWTPPGIRADEDGLVTKLTEHGHQDRLEASFPQLMELGEWRPEEPHFYLHLIGARDTARGQGLGSVLLRRVLDVCDAEGTPAYLEASTTRSAALYERHGFEEIGTVDLAPGVVLRPMLRAAT
jgi:GNAT superfamily N-acetyltransferase